MFESSSPLTGSLCSSQRSLHAWWNCGSNRDQCCGGRCHHQNEKGAICRCGGFRNRLQGILGDIWRTFSFQADQTYVSCSKYLCPCLCQWLNKNSEHRTGKIGNMVPHFERTIYSICNIRGFDCWSLRTSIANNSTWSCKLLEQSSWDHEIVGAWERTLHGLHGSTRNVGPSYLMKKP